MHEFDEYVKNTVKLFASIAITYVLLLQLAFIVILVMRYIEIGPEAIGEVISDWDKLKITPLWSLLFSILAMFHYKVYIFISLLYLALVVYLFKKLKSFFEFKVLIPLMFGWGLYGYYCLIVVGRFY